MQKVAIWSRRGERNFSIVSNSPGLPLLERNFSIVSHSPGHIPCLADIPTPKWGEEHLQLPTLWSRRGERNFLIISTLRMPPPGFRSRAISVPAPSPPSTLRRQNCSRFCGPHAYESSIVGVYKQPGAPSFLVYFVFKRWQSGTNCILRSVSDSYPVASKRRARQSSEPGRHQTFSTAAFYPLFLFLDCRLRARKSSLVLSKIRRKARRSLFTKIWQKRPTSFSFELFENVDRLYQNSPTRNFGLLGPFLV